MLESTLENETQPISSMPAVPKSKPKPKTGSKSAEEWNVVKTDIYQFYVVEDLALSAVMERLEHRTAFVQSCVCIKPERTLKPRSC